MEWSSPFESRSRTSQDSIGATPEARAVFVEHGVVGVEGVEAASRASGPTSANGAARPKLKRSAAARLQNGGYVHSASQNRPVRLRPLTGHSDTHLAKSAYGAKFPALPASFTLSVATASALSAGARASVRLLIRRRGHAETAAEGGREIGGVAIADIECGLRHRPPLMPQAVARLQRPLLAHGSGKPAGQPLPRT